MAKATHYSATGEHLGEVDLPAAVFDVEVNTHVIWEAVRSYLANQRQGTSKVKTRADVSGGGRKPYRQKGSGRARRGTTRAPLHRGGGRAHGPQPRNYGYALPKRIRTLALRSALAARAQDNQVAVVDKLELAEPKTRDMASLAGKVIGDAASCLIVLADYNDNASLASRNLKNVKTCTAGDLNTYAVMHAGRVVFEKDGLKKIEEVLKS